jgi:uncharacterized protein
MPEFPRGRFCWHELLTTDTHAAASFYRQVVGWNATSWPADPSYRIWMMGQKQIGGLMALQEEAKAMGAPPSWLFYLAVPDAAATVRRVSELGGRVVKDATTIQTVGTFAVLRDPQGAVFAVLQPAGSTPGHDGEPKPGEFSWHELATTDPDAAWRFYQSVFGWKETSSFDMGPSGMYRMYGRVGIPLGGIYRKPPEMPGPSSWLCYAMVPNADRAADTAARIGGKVLNGPMEVPGGDRIAQCMDPQGVMFAVHSRATTVPTKPSEPTGTRAKAKKKAVKRTTKRKSAKKATKKRVTKKRSKVAKKSAKKKRTKKRTTKKKKATKNRAKRKASRRKSAKKKGARRKTSKKRRR